MVPIEGIRRRRTLMPRTVFVIGAYAIGFASPGAHAQPLGQPTTASPPRRLAIGISQTETVSIPKLEAGRTYSLLVTLEGGQLQQGDRLKVTLSGAGNHRFTKDLHAGDTDMYLPYRPDRDGPATIELARQASAGDGALTVRVDWHDSNIPIADITAIEAEPNDSWREANLLQLGRDVYGTADDVDYLDNSNEGKLGLDWFRFEVTDDKPLLVYFQLDLLDRDVSANLKVYKLNPKTNEPEPYVHGKDPMEIVHDRERERYSKHISRTFTRGIVLSRRERESSRLHPQDPSAHYSPLQ